MSDYDLREREMENEAAEQERIAVERSDPFDTVKEWREQFIAVTDPLDVWLCIDGNYVRPATKQESEMLTALASIEERLRVAEERAEALESIVIAARRRAEAAERRVKELEGICASTADDPLPWEGERVFCNPPWSSIPPFVEMAATADLAVLLVPARTNCRWFHRALELEAVPRFFKPKIKFVGAKHVSPVDCVLLVFGQTEESGAKR